MKTKDIVRMQSLPFREARISIPSVFICCDDEIGIIDDAENINIAVTVIARVRLWRESLACRRAVLRIYRGGRGNPMYNALNV